MEGYCGAEKVEERLDKQYSDNKCMCCFCLEDPKSRLIWTFYHCRHKYLGYHPFWAFYKIQYLSLCFVLDNIYQGNLSLSRPHNIKKYHIVSLHLNLKRWILMDKTETFVWFIAFWTETRIVNLATASRISEYFRDNPPIVKSKHYYICSILCVINCMVEWSESSNGKCIACDNLKYVLEWSRVFGGCCGQAATLLLNGDTRNMSPAPALNIMGECFYRD